MQKIEHSVRWKKLFENFVKEGGQPVVRNFSTAAHRFESLTKPLGRFCLHLETLARVASHICIVRGQKDAAHAAAKRFLEGLREEHFLQMCTLADASDEALGLVRAVDSEDADSAGVYLKLQSFMDSIHVLFHNEAVLGAAGPPALQSLGRDSKGGYVAFSRI